MADCKFCGRTGWFLSVSSNGLCSNCEPSVLLEVSQRLRIINDSVRIIESSKNLDVRLSRCECLLENARALVKFEERGIPTTDPLPSSYVTTYRNAPDMLIRTCLEDLVKQTLMKAPLAPTARSQINQATKALLKIQDYLDRARDKQGLANLQDQLKGFIHSVQLDTYLESAKKAEFKGQGKKALDQYREALYFLKHDEIDDALQVAHVSKVEAKIHELESELESKKK